MGCNDRQAGLSMKQQSMYINKNLFSVLLGILGLSLLCQHNSESNNFVRIIWNNRMLKNRNTIIDKREKFCGIHRFFEKVFPINFLRGPQLFYNLVQGA